LADQVKLSAEIIAAGQHTWKIKKKAFDEPNMDIEYLISGNTNIEDFIKLNRVNT
jgi:hypothetical protein